MALGKVECFLGLYGALTSCHRSRHTTRSVRTIWRLSPTENLPQTGMPELQEGRQGALLQGSDDSSRQHQLAGPAVRERNSGVDRLLELLQDETQRLLEQLCHEFCLERCPKDSTSTQHTEDVRGEHGPIRWSCFLSRRRLVLDRKHRSLALITVQDIHQLCDPPLRYATESEEQWQAQPAWTLKNLRNSIHATFVGRVDG